MEPAYFEREVEALSTALARRRYRHDAGLEATLDLVNDYEGYERLCSPETFERLDDTPIDPKQLRSLRRFVAEQFLESGARALTERVANFETGTTVLWNGAPLPYRAAQVAQWTEPEQERRHELAELVLAETARLTRPRLERLSVVGGLVGELGYRDMVSLWSELHGLALPTLNETAEQILAASSSLYDQTLRDYLVHHQLAGDVWEVDLQWIFLGAELERDYPSQRTVPSLYRTFRELGLALEDQSNLRLDRAARPLKRQAPFCSPIAVPDEVIGVLLPLGGRRELDWLLEVVGLAEPFVQVDGTQPFAHRRLGDVAVGRGYGELFRALGRDPGWLRSRLEVDDPRDHLRLASFEALYRLRRAAAMFRFEQELHASEEPESLGESYAEQLGGALSVRVAPEQYLSEVGEQPIAAHALRGAMLGAQLSLFLRGEYDDEWSRSSRAGGFLLDRWREGLRYTADEFAQFCGFDALDPSPLLAELRERLAV
ncbi:MAG: hypothetical protein H0W09_06305 [Solirubrobacterales bacterium]|nr:hypothetical protein [Solirubrobacterales bacterium]